MQVNSKFIIYIIHCNFAPKFMVQDVDTLSNGNSMEWIILRCKLLTSEFGRDHNDILTPTLKYIGVLPTMVTYS